MTARGSIDRPDCSPEERAGRASNRSQRRAIFVGVPEEVFQDTSLMPAAQLPANETHRAWQQSGAIAELGALSVREALTSSSVSRFCSGPSRVTGSLLVPPIPTDGPEYMR